VLSRRGVSSLEWNWLELRQKPCCLNFSTDGGGAAGRLVLFTGPVALPSALDCDGRAAFWALLREACVAVNGPAAVGGCRSIALCYSGGKSWRGSVGLWAGTDGPDVISGGGLSSWSVCRGPG
jgi:hypothetical protein